MLNVARGQRRLSRTLLLMALITLFAVGSLGASAVSLARSQTAGGPFRTANGIVIQAGNPLPIFKLTAPSLTRQGVVNLSQLFSGIYDRQTALPDTYRNVVRYTVPNTLTESILEQYGATGGFFAYNAKAAFDETVPAGTQFSEGLARQLGCTFLFNRFVNADGRILIGYGSGKPSVQDNVSVPSPNCTDPKLDYRVSLIKGTTQAAGSQTPGPEQVLGALVQVPISINTAQYLAQNTPLSGPGGHMSLLLRPTAPGIAANGFTSLDNSVPGLAAVAMPFYDRNVTERTTAPALDPATVKTQVENAVKASYPGGTVNVPDPNLVYKVDEAGAPQGSLEPKLNFQGITVTVGGTTFTLKDIDVPAVQSGTGGFGPAVSITSPGSGTKFTPGSGVAFTGSITGGAPPYNYRWELEDGTLLSQGNLPNDGTVSLTTSQLPVVSHNGTPAAVTVYLRVTDNNDAERSALVSLNPSVAPAAYLAAVYQNYSSSTALQARPANPIRLLASNYSFGTEMGSDYPPYGPGGSDLPGVPPDVAGFRSGMLSYGWSQKFAWANASAWERDWRDCSLGGGDCTYGVDRTDFAYYSGHGSNGGIALPSSVDSSWFPGTNARYSTLRWAAFSSCLTLRAQPNDSTAPIRNWFNAFQGAHMLLGFNSLMADIAFGGPLMDNMRMPTFFGIPFPWAQRTIREAWVLTAFNMNAGKPAYIYAVGTNGVNPVNNKLPLPTDAPLPRPFPVASWHWVWWSSP